MKITANMHYAVRAEESGDFFYLNHFSEKVDIEIREISYSDAPIAFLRQVPITELMHLQNPKNGHFPRGFSLGCHRKYGSYLRVEYRLYNDKLYVRDYARNYVKNGVGIVTKKNLTGLFSEFRASKDYTKENAYRVLFVAAGRYMLIDGDVWISTTEPAYRLDSEPGEGKCKEMYTAILSESHNPSRIVEYYNALQWEDVLKVAKERSLIRDEPEMVSRKLGALRKIEIVMPEAVLIPKRKVRLYNEGPIEDRITTAFPYYNDSEDPKKRRDANGQERLVEARPNMPYAYRSANSRKKKEKEKKGA